MSGLKLTSIQRQRLEEQLRHTHDAELLRRTLAILDFSRGEPVNRIAERLGVTRRSVYHWIAAYSAWPHPAALATAPRSGRPPLWSEQTQQALQMLMNGSPQDWGYPATDWTAPLPRLWNPWATGASRAIRFAGDCANLITCGNVPVTRSRRIPSERKKRRILRELRRIGPRGVILAQDETDLLLFPPLRAGWIKRGQSKPVLLSGYNARRVIFGALNLRTGKRLFMESDRQRQEDVEAFVDLVAEHYRAWEAHLLLDEDPSHIGEQTQMLVDQYGIEMHWLPNRAPELNPMDTFWGQAKDVVCANKQYATIEEQVERFLDYAQSVSDDQALQLSGVFSKNFWLKDVL